jgi:hypothetical protein
MKDKISFEQYKKISSEGYWKFVGRYDGEFDVPSEDSIFYIRDGIVEFEEKFALLDVKMYAGVFQCECENQIHFKKGLNDTKNDEESTTYDVKEMQDLLNATSSRKSRSKVKILEAGKRYRTAITFRNKYLGGTKN